MSLLQSVNKHLQGGHDQETHGLWAKGRNLPIGKNLQAIADRFNSAGFRIYAVGGAVRDFAMGKHPHDIDLTTNATPTEMKFLFGKQVKDWDDRGEEHGMVRIKSGDEVFEVAAHRRDVQTDGRHATVAFTTSIADDLQRRDLTINALAYDLINHHLYGTGDNGDPTPNLDDLRNKTIRFVGNGYDRIFEDRLRALRAIRFAVRMGGKLAPETIQSIRDAVDRGLIPAENLSWERIRDEMIKTLGHPNGGSALRLYKETGLLFSLFPELQPAEDQPQNKHHGDVKVLEHIFRTVEATNAPKGAHSAFTGLAKVLGKKSDTDPISPDELAEAGLGVLRLTMMLHDIAKPQTAAEKPDAAGEYSFLGHDEQGAEVARKITERLKMPAEITDMISVGVGEHMKVPEPTASDSSIRRWARTLYERNPRLRDSGIDLVDWMLSIRESDWGALGRERGDTGEERIRSVLSAQPKTIKPPISGDTVMRLTGLKPGKAIGQIVRGIGEFLDSTPDAPQEVIDAEVMRLYESIKGNLEKHYPGLHDQETHDPTPEYDAPIENKNGDQKAAEPVAVEKPAETKSIEGVSLDAWKAMSDDDKDLFANATASIKSRLKSLTDQFGEHNLAADAKDIAPNRLKQVGNDYVTEDVAKLLIDGMNEYSQALQGAGIDAETSKKMIAYATDALLVQENETLGRQLGDHGIRHLMGDVNMSLDILEKHPAHDDPKALVALYIAGIHHDTGYVTPPGGKVGMDGRHPTWSKQHYDANMKEDITKVLGQEWSEKIGHMIQTHDATELDWENDPVTSALRVADNMALFHKEKLPGLFKHVPKNIKALINLGAGTTDLETTRNIMRDNVKTAGLSKPITERLLKAVDEVGEFSPKFTLGMLGGYLEKTEWEKDHLSVSMHRNRAAVRLQKQLDLGQAQFIKLAKTYLGKDLGKLAGDEFSFNDKNGKVLISFSVTGEMIKGLLSVVGKHLQGQHDQATHGNRDDLWWNQLDTGALRSELNQNDGVVSDGKGFSFDLYRAAYRHFAESLSDDFVYWHGYGIADARFGPERFNLPEDAIPESSLKYLNELAEYLEVGGYELPDRHLDYGLEQANEAYDSYQDMWSPEVEEVASLSPDPKYTTASKARLIRLKSGALCVEKYPSNRTPNNPKVEAEDEVMAYQLASVFEINVPETQMRIDDNGNYIVRQRYIENATSRWESGFESRAKQNPQTIKRSAMLDFVMAQEDRHPGNWIIDEQNNVWLIDNGASGINSSRYWKGIHGSMVVDLWNKISYSQSAGVEREKDLSVLNAVTNDEKLPKPMRMRADYLSRVWRQKSSARIPTALEVSKDDLWKSVYDEWTQP